MDKFVPRTRTRLVHAQDIPSYETKEAYSGQDAKTGPGLLKPADLGTEM